MKSKAEVKSEINKNKVEIKNNKEKVTYNAVKHEIALAFSESRGFPFFLNKMVLSQLRAGTEPESLKPHYKKIRNEIFSTISENNDKLKNRFTKDALLSSIIVNAVSNVHKAIAELSHDHLPDRRFVLIKEKHGSMAIYNSIDKSPIISHVGLGPRWIEIPTIYLGLNIFNALALEYTEQKKKRNGLFEAFKSLLILEERAIETGFSHAGVISTELNKDLGLLVDKIIRFSKLAKIESVETSDTVEALGLIESPEIVEASENKKIFRFTEETRKKNLRMLDARHFPEESLFNCEKNLTAIKSIERQARRYKRGDDLQSIREIVRLLVAASGHDIHEVRNRASVILERLLAPKEFDAPLAAHFINLRPFTMHCFEFDLPRVKSGYFLRIYRNRLSHDFILEKELDFLELDLQYNRNTGRFTAQYLFDELGHYDYLVYKKKSKGGCWLSQKGCSGRINVIPDMSGEIILEIFPDIHGHTRVYWKDRTGHPGLVYNENGEVIRLGRFSDITAHLKDLKNRYRITSIYLLGVQKRGSNREDWTPEATSPSPFSPVSLSEIEPSLGGEKEFKELVKKAHTIGVKIIVDMIPHINRKSSDVPDDYVVKCYDDGGNLVERASTDGRYGSWNDGKLLNYRKFEVWEYIARSILTLIEKYDIDGIRFDSSHAVPIMMKKNNYPYFYGTKRSHEEMVEGTIIVNDREDDHFITTGYFDSACSEIISSPFHYYSMLAIQRKLREKNKSFFINIAECYWGHERFLARTGIVPYNSALLKICENIIRRKTDVREIYHLYDKYFPSALPPGTELLGILGNHDEPRILNTFGPMGFKATAMLTSFMSNIILDYEGSAEGETWKVYLDNIYVNWNRFESASHRGFERFYRELYVFHRKNKGKGYLIWANNNMVAAALKVTEKGFWIGAFNFSDNNQHAFLQFDKPELPIEDSAFYKVVDPMYSSVTDHYNYYSGQELRVSKLQMVITYTDRVKLLKLEKVDNPGRYFHEFLRDSFFRLCTISKAEHFQYNFAFLKIASHTDSFDRFSSFILDRLIPLFSERKVSSLELGLKRALFHIFRNRLCSGKKLMVYIDLLSHNTNQELKKLGLSLTEHNQKGPLVFISAEAEPFSKIGGLANVVYELPRKLAELGEEVCVITPIYKNGDEKSLEKMKKAIKKYDIKYTGKNVRFMIRDKEYEVGVHYGVVDGINYYLLDHHEFFDGLYWGYTAEEKLRRRIAFARSCAEVITTMGLCPLFTFTNDAFTGIFNAVVRGDRIYLDNSNFKRTCFLHVIHNNGWKYFDSYDRYEKGRDLFSLFNLPYRQADNFSDPINTERINCMAAGARFSDRVITVSPTYARQIETGCEGLEHIMNDLIGINNAIGRDFLRGVKQRFRGSGFVETCYPVLMDHIRKDNKLRKKIETSYPEILRGAHFCESVKDKIKRENLTRMRNKMLLQVKHGLAVDPDKIIFTMIHRIVEQKGFQLILEASEGIFKNLNFQGIIGGPISIRDQKSAQIAHGLTLLRNYYPESVCVNIGFLDVSIPLLCSDVFLMPSLYEPGGISQLEAFACGCLVVARSTGGLIDTVHPLRIHGKTVEGNGFLFTDFTPGSFYHAMESCSAFFTHTDEKILHKARVNARRSVFFWDRPAKKYITEIYTIKEIIRAV